MPCCTGDKQKVKGSFANTMLAQRPALHGSVHFSSSCDIVLEAFRMFAGGLVSS